MWKTIAAIATILSILGYFAIGPKQVGAFTHKLIIMIGTYVLPVIFFIFSLIFAFKLIGRIFGLGKEKKDRD